VTIAKPCLAVPAVATGSELMIAVQEASGNAVGATATDRQPSMHV
jgi:hypothetical protein